MRSTTPTSVVHNLTQRSEPLNSKVVIILYIIAKKTKDCNILFKWFPYMMLPTVDMFSCVKVHVVENAVINILTYWSNQRPHYIVVDWYSLICTSQQACTYNHNYLGCSNVESWQKLIWVLCYSTPCGHLLEAGPKQVFDSQCLAM